VTIVVGFVPTKEGRAALARAVEEAKMRRARLVVINSNRGGREFDDDTKAAEAELQRVADELSGDGLELEVRQLVRGNEPAEDLISVANETDAYLIVIGLRRRTPVGKLILGSNAQRILLDAPCAVLAVKG
jgi:nucleotide-binding universal stress UspA family protein